MSNLSLSKIETALKNAGLLVSTANSAKDIDAISRVTNRPESVDSRTAFLAYRGVSHDGHANISQAVQNKAPVVILEDSASIQLCSETPYFLVTSARSAWSKLESELQGNPQEKLRLIGITGTNGKTSTAWITRSILELQGYKSGSIGTLGATADGRNYINTGHTSPDPNVLYTILRTFSDAGITFAVLEVASHGLVQNKFDPIRFDAAGFTSFSQDHLDFHGTMANYFDAKLSLPENLLKKSAKFFVAERVLGSCRDQGLNLPPSSKNWLSYGFGDSSNTPHYLIVQGKADASGTELSINLDGVNHSGVIRFFGHHSLENFALSLIISHQMTGKLLSPDRWAQVPPVPGRFEPVFGRYGQPRVFVDYAHTPDALQNVLTLARSLGPKRLSVVFGCGGNRDAKKRPLMGAIASKLADRIFVTSDNPRHEKPAAIIQDIASGVPKESVVSHFIEDRRRAITEAIATGISDEIIVIAGKGHETYQQIGDTKIPFDDRLVAKDSLNG